MTMSKEAVIKKDAGLKHEVIKTAVAYLKLDQGYYVETEKEIEVNDKTYRIDVWASREQSKRQLNGKYTKPNREVQLIEICGSKENYDKNKEKLLELAPLINAEVSDFLLRADNYSDNIREMKQELMSDLPK